MPEELAQPDASASPAPEGGAGAPPSAEAAAAAVILPPAAPAPQGEFVRCAACGGAGRLEEGPICPKCNGGGMILNSQKSAAEAFIEDAQRNAAKILEDAKAQAAVIIGNAEKKAAQILDKAFRENGQ